MVEIIEMVGIFIKYMLKEKEEKKYIKEEYRKHLIFENNGNKRKFFTQFYVLKTKLKDLTLQESEVASVEWLPMQEVFQMIRQGKTRFPYDKKKEKIFRKVEEHYQSKNKEEMQK